jgi:photosystem II stability/assembly factor-like uncharacterized protein
MKFYTVFLFVFVFSSRFYTQWLPANTFTEQAWLNSVFFTDDEHGWIAGSGGTILKFDAESFCWNKVETPAINNLNSVAFFDNMNGFAVGEDGVLFSTIDGGDNWNISSIDTTDLNGISIVNDNSAYITGKNGLLLRTNDKGITWNNVLVPSKKGFFSVHFINERKGFVGTDSSTLLITNDGGITWREEFFEFTTFDPPVVNAISFPDSMNGYIGGGFPHLGYLFRKTTDGGETWETEEIAHPFGNIRSMFFRNTEFGVITGGNNTWDKFLQVKTLDGYETMIYHNEDYDIMSCYITPSGKGWAVGGGGSIFYAEDYRKGWGQIFAGSEDTPAAISVSRDNNFFLESIRNNFREPWSLTMRAYNNNKLWKDVPRYWNQSGWDTITNLDMIDSMTGFKSSYYNFYRTYNGGYTWELVSGTPQDERIHFLDVSAGWRYGDFIYKTTNGGSEWILQVTPGVKITDLQFTDEYTGYACGSNGNLKGVIIKSTNGGDTWYQLNTPRTGHLTSVAFMDAQNGIAAGWGSTILKTSNGGKTWEQVSRGDLVKTKNLFSKKKFLKSNDKRYITTNVNGFTRITAVAGRGNYLDAEFRGGVIFIASDEGAVLSSADFGNSWKTDNVGEVVLEIKYDGRNYVAARTEKNVYIYRIEIPAISKNIALTSGQTNTVKDFKLEQNYPNPFNPSTKIRYQVPAAGEVSVKLLDALGRELAVLENSVKEPGVYEINFDSGKYSLSSGVYLYSIRAGDYVSTKKMILLK